MPTHSLSNTAQRDLVDAIVAYVADRAVDGNEVATDVSALHIAHWRAPGPLRPSLYTPSLCVVLQGRKVTHVASRRLRIGAGQSVLVSHDVPVVVRITDASEKTPYVALVVGLDLGIARQIAAQVDDPVDEPRGPRSLEVGPTDPVLLDAVGRLFQCTASDEDARVLAPLVVQEIHYRLLRTEQGGLLRGLLKQRSQASRVAKAIAHLRAHYAEPVSISDVASSVGMSPSSFHEHFKAVTSTTPLQYQKELRLLEARRLLLDGTHSVTDAALEVGYASAAQFSREYARKYGRPPRVDRR